jgi:endo-1,4-beta-mannosidase
MIEYTVKVYSNGTKSWYLNGKRHREDGPAVEGSDGSKCWYLNDKLHREDGPAVEWSNGYKCWYLNDKLHREDGPAVEHPNGVKGWHLDGKELTEQEHKAATSKPTCEGKIVEIDGKKYELKGVQQ